VALNAARWTVVVGSALLALAWIGLSLPPAPSERMRVAPRRWRARHAKEE